MFRSLLHQFGSHLKTKRYITIQNKAVFYQSKSFYSTLNSHEQLLKLIKENPLLQSKIMQFQQLLVQKGYNLTGKPDMSTILKMAQDSELLNILKDIIPILQKANLNPKDFDMSGLMKSLSLPAEEKTTGLSDKLKKFVGTK